ncbi:GGDEF domain-containing protein [Sneathiella sp.]|uniref:GGDEF domain-containing protein n=1 Tax=Sneathiella sp. TaxID=1964365 RepID=UPI002FE27F25
MLVFIYNVFSGGGRQALSLEGLDRLFSTRSHSPLLKRRRARVILSRVRFLSLVSAFAFPLGYLLDMLTFDSEAAQILGITRGLIAVLFLALYFGISKGESLRDAYRAIGIFFAILLAFQAMYQPLLGTMNILGATSLAAAGYALFPFLIIACIATFPLTVKESVLLLALLFVVQMLILVLMPESADQGQRVGILLTLSAAGLLAAFGAISQQLYMSLLIDHASIDTLTGVYSRNSGEEIIDVQFRISKRQNTPFSLVFIDIDNFKSINDRYGHEAGDRVLANAATNIRRNARGSDVVIRWGGEEFVVLLPNTDAAGAMKSMRRLRNIGLGLRPDGKMVTASFGIVDRQSVSVADWTALVDIADNQMYEAKSRGGDDISVYVPSDTPAAAPDRPASAAAE